MKSKQSNLKKVWPLLLFFLLIFYTYAGNFGVIRESVRQDVDNASIGELIKDTVVEQSFYFDQNNLSGISIKLATYVRNNNGKILVSIRQKGEHRNIYETTIQSNSISDNEFFDFRFPPIKFSKGKNYTIFIKAEEGVKGNSITMYKSSANTYSNGELYLNGLKQEGDLVFKAYYNRTIFDYMRSKLGG